MTIKNTIVSIIFSLALVFALGTSMAYAQTGSTGINASGSATVEIDAQPVSFFERLGLFFTFNAERKSEKLQDFSKRNFDIAREKLEAGDTTTAQSYFQKSDDDTRKASDFASRISDDQLQEDKLEELSATASYRVEALTEAQARIKNPIAQEAIDRALERQAEVKNDVDAKIQSLLTRIAQLEAKIKELENNGSASGEKPEEEQEFVDEGIDAITPPTGQGNSESSTGGNSESGAGRGTVACNSNTAPYIKVLSPNGGESYNVGEPISVTWTSCNMSSDTLLEINVYSRSPQVFGFFAENGTENDGIEKISSESLPVGSNYEVVVGVPRGGFDNSALSIFDNSDATFKIGSSLENSDDENSQLSCAGITITSPQQNAQVTFPLTVSGIIHPTGTIFSPNPWIVFEGEAGTVVVKNSAGVAISAPQILTLSGEWMNTTPKPFSVTILNTAQLSNSQNISLYFTDNQQSDEGVSHSCSLPVRL